MSQIYQLTHQDIKDENTLYNFIYKREDLNYYYSDSFNQEFYIDLAKAGFISVSHNENDLEYLLPEIQKEYAILDFKDIYIGTKVAKLLKRAHLYSFEINQRFDEVVEHLETFHKNSWINGKYKELLKTLHKTNDDNNFKLLSFELVCSATDTITAAEIGYIIGKTYTSLSGFSSREKKYNNFGKLQLVLLGEYLQKNNFDFWNLGHPHMQYKLDFGAKIYSRKDFLSRWSLSIKV
ncbi:MAG: hypothetical protein U9Q20_03240 [Campylobacterota bacterium]|nr:hypothetical protein [Campylobacterota bacterium]